MYVVKIMYKEDFSDCFETELCSILYKFADLRHRNEPKNLRICGFAIAEFKKRYFCPPLVFIQLES
jgi:hypothetical protein